MILTTHDKKMLADMGATTDEIPRIQAVASYSKPSLPLIRNAPITHPSLIRLIGRKVWLSLILYSARNRMTPTSTFEWGDAKTAKVDLRFSIDMLPKWYREKHAIA